MHGGWEPYTSLKARLGEIKYALKKMKIVRAMTHDDIPSADWNSLGELSIAWLIKLFNKIIDGNKCLENGN